MSKHQPHHKAVPAHRREAHAPHERQARNAAAAEHVVRSGPAPSPPAHPVISSNARSSKFADPKVFRGEASKDAAGAVAAMHADASDYVASLFDPFNHPGARVPDLLSIGSATAQSLRRITLNAKKSPDLTKYGVWFGLDACADGCQTTAGTLANDGTYGTFTAVDDPEQAVLLSNAYAIRVVSMGLRLNNVTAQLNRGGQVMFARTPGGSAQFKLDDYSVSPYAMYLDAADQDLVSKVLTWRPVDYDTSLAYFAPSLNITDGRLVFIMQGSVDFSVEVELVTNYQILPLPTVANIFSLGVSAAGPSESNQAMAVADTMLGTKASVTAAVPATGHESGIAAVISKGVSFLGKAVGGLVRRSPIGAMLGGLLGQSLYREHLRHTVALLDGEEVKTESAFRQYLHHARLAPPLRGLPAPDFGVAARLSELYGPSRPPAPLAPPPPSDRALSQAVAPAATSSPSDTVVVRRGFF